MFHFSPIMLISALTVGAVSAWIAHKKGKNPYLWFAAGFFLGILGVFAIFFASGRKKTQQAPKQEPIFLIEGPKDKFWYYLNPTQEQMGPVSHDALTKAWKAGKIDSSTFVWHEELENWKPLKELISISSSMTISN